MMHAIFHRNRFTWLAYLSLAVYGYFLNILGPITPLLKDELGQTVTPSRRERVPRSHLVLQF